MPITKYWIINRPAERHLDDDNIPALLNKAWSYGIDGKHGLDELQKKLNNGGNFEGVVR